jgi:hypothetical protein
MVASLPPPATISNQEDPPFIPHSSGHSDLTPVFILCTPQNVDHAELIHGTGQETVSKVSKARDGWGRLAIIFYQKFNMRFESFVIGWREWECSEIVVVVAVVCDGRRDPDDNGEGSLWERSGSAQQWSPIISA